MRLIWDLDRQKFVQFVGTDVTVREVVMIRGSAFPLELLVVKDGAPALVEGALFGAVVKASGEFDSESFVPAVTFTPDEERTLYTAALNFITEELDALFHVNGNGADDAAQLVLSLGFGLSEDDGASWTPSPTLKLKLLNNTFRGTETPAVAAASSQIEYLRAVVGLTGGGSTKLDGKATPGLAAGKLVAVVDDGASGVLRFYELAAGTDAESAPDVIRPDDFDAEDNAFVWKLRNPNAGGATPLNIKPIETGGWGEPYQVTLDDLDKFVLSDIGNESVGYIRLPKIADVIARGGGVVRVASSREPVGEGDSANMVAVYPHAEDGGVRFLLGPNNLYSLFSSSARDTLLLIPWNEGGDWFWMALDFAGWWADRD